MATNPEALQHSGETRPTPDQLKGMEELLALYNQAGRKRVPAKQLNRAKKALIDAGIADEQQLKRLSGKAVFTKIQQALAEVRPRQEYQAVTPETESPLPPVEQARFRQGQVIEATDRFVKETKQQKPDTATKEEIQWLNQLDDDAVVAGQMTVDDIDSLLTAAGLDVPDNGKHLRQLNEDMTAAFRDNKRSASEQQVADRYLESLDDFTAAADEDDDLSVDWGDAGAPPADIPTETTVESPASPVTAGAEDYDDMLERVGAAAEGIAEQQLDQARAAVTAASVGSVEAKPDTVVSPEGQRHARQVADQAVRAAKAGKRGKAVAKQVKTAAGATAYWQAEYEQALQDSGHEDDVSFDVFPDADTAASEALVARGGSGMPASAETAVAGAGIGQVSAERLRDHAEAVETARQLLQYFQDLYQQAHSRMTESESSQAQAVFQEFQQAIFKKSLSGELEALSAKDIDLRALYDKGVALRQQMEYMASVLRDASGDDHRITKTDKLVGAASSSAATFEPTDMSQADFEHLVNDAIDNFASSSQPDAAGPATAEVAAVSAEQRTALQADVDQVRQQLVDLQIDATDRLTVKQLQSLAEASRQIGRTALELDDAGETVTSQDYDHWRQVVDMAQWVVSQLEQSDVTTDKQSPAATEEELMTDYAGDIGADAAAILRQERGVVTEQASPATAEQTTPDSSDAATESSINSQDIDYSEAYQDLHTGIPRPGDFGGIAGGAFGYDDSFEGATTASVEQPVNSEAAESVDQLLTVQHLVAQALLDKTLNLSDEDQEYLEQVWADLKAGKYDDIESEDDLRAVMAKVKEILPAGYAVRELAAETDTQARQEKQLEKTPQSLKGWAKKIAGGSLNVAASIFGVKALSDVAGLAVGRISEMRIEADEQGAKAGRGKGWGTLYELRRQTAVAKNLEKHQEKLGQQLEYWRQRIDGLNVPPAQQQALMDRLEQITAQPQAVEGQRQQSLLQVADTHLRRGNLRAQAIGDAMDTALVATGAIPLRILSRVGFRAVGRGVEARQSQKRGEENAPSVLGRAMVGGFSDAWKNLKDIGDKDRSTGHRAMAAGKALSTVAVAAGVTGASIGALSAEGVNSQDIEDMLADVKSWELLSAGKIAAGNVVENVQRIIEFYAHPIQSGEAAWQKLRAQVFDNNELMVKGMFTQQGLNSQEAERIINEMKQADGVVSDEDIAKLGQLMATNEGKIDVDQLATDFDTPEEQFAKAVAAKVEQLSQQAGSSVQSQTLESLVTTYPDAPAAEIITRGQLLDQGVSADSIELLGQQAGAVEQIDVESVIATQRAVNQLVPSDMQEKVWLATVENSHFQGTAGQARLTELADKQAALSTVQMEGKGLFDYLVQQKQGDLQAVERTVDNMETALGGTVNTESVQGELNRMIAKADGHADLNAVLSAEKVVAVNSGDTMAQLLHQQFDVQNGAASDELKLRFVNNYLGKGTVNGAEDLTQSVINQAIAKAGAIEENLTHAGNKLLLTSSGDVEMIKGEAALDARRVSETALRQAYLEEVVGVKNASNIEITGERSFTFVGADGNTYTVDGAGSTSPDITAAVDGKTVSAKIDPDGAVRAVAPETPAAEPVGEPVAKPEGGDFDYELRGTPTGIEALDTSGFSLGTTREFSSAVTIDDGELMQNVFLGGPRAGIEIDKIKTSGGAVEFRVNQELAGKDKRINVVIDGPAMTIKAPGGDTVVLRTTDAQLEQLARPAVFAVTEGATTAEQRVKDVLAGLSDDAPAKAELAAFQENIFGTTELAEATPQRQVDLLAQKNVGAEYMHDRRADGGGKVFKNIRDKDGVLKFKVNTEAGWGDVKYDIHPTGVIIRDGQPVSDTRFKAVFAADVRKAAGK